MYEYLRQHPQVFMPRRKEPVYFGADLAKRRPLLDEAGYLRLFEPGAGRLRLGEATVWYLYSATAPAEIDAFAPDALIIIMLRNPVDMIASLHSQLLFSGSENLASLEEALEAEAERAAGRRIPPGSRRPEGLLYRRCARYAEHVRRYLDTFGRDRVKIILFDDFRRDPAEVYRQTLEFLGLDPGFQPDFAVINANKVPRSRLLQKISSSERFVAATAGLPDPLRHVLWRLTRRANIRLEQRPAVPPHVRARLMAELRADVEVLERLIDRDLSGWSLEAEAVE